VLPGTIGLLVGVTAGPAGDVVPVADGVVTTGLFDTAAGPGSTGEVVAGLPVRLGLGPELSTGDAEVLMDWKVHW